MNWDGVSKLNNGKTWATRQRNRLLGSFEWKTLSKPFCARGSPTSFSSRFVYLARRQPLTMPISSSCCTFYDAARVLVHFDAIAAFFSLAFSWQMQFIFRATLSSPWEFGCSTDIGASGVSLCQLWGSLRKHLPRAYIEFFVSREVLAAFSWK